MDEVPQPGLLIVKPDTLPFQALLVSFPEISSPRANITHMHENSPPNPVGKHASKRNLMLEKHQYKAEGKAYSIGLLPFPLLLSGPQKST